MPPRLLRFVRFNAVGLIGIGVQMAAVAALVEGLGLHYALATALAIEISVLHNFAWHERWTWGGQAGRGARGILLRGLLFHAGNGCVSLVGTMALLPVLVGHLRLHYLVANLLTIAVTGVLNFLLGDHVVFAAGRQPGAVR